MENERGRGMNTEYYKVNRSTIVERLLESWAAHYDCMADDELVREFQEYINPTKPHNVVVELGKDDE
jgi:hypothetical protein